MPVGYLSLGMKMIRERWGTKEDHGTCPSSVRAPKDEESEWR